MLTSLCIASLLCDCGGPDGQNTPLRCVRRAIGSRIRVPVAFLLSVRSLPFRAMLGPAVVTLTSLQEAVMGLLDELLGGLAGQPAGGRMPQPRMDAQAGGGMGNVLMALLPVVL